MKDSGYDIPAVSKITGISDRTLRFCIDVFLLEPELVRIRASGREGRRKLFSVANVMQALLLQAMSYPEFSIEHKRQIIGLIDRLRLPDRDILSASYLERNAHFIGIQRLQEPSPDSVLGDLQYTVRDIGRMTLKRNHGAPVTAEDFKSGEPIMLISMNVMYEQIKDGL